MMFNKLRHQHSEYESATHEWFCTDSKFNHDKNLQDPSKRLLLEQHGWLENPVRYSFNSHGFRSDEFDSSRSAVLFLGASIVVGTGVSDEHVWTTLVSQRLDCSNYNLGISGGSNDSSFRIGQHYIPQLSPKLVIFVSSYKWRTDLIVEDRVLTFMDPEISTPKPYQAFYKEWIRCPENGELNYLKNKYALHQLCESLNIPIIEIDGHEVYSMAKHSKGRDLVHPGIEGHKLIADYIFEKVVAVAGSEPATFRI